MRDDKNCVWRLCPVRVSKPAKRTREREREREYTLKRSHPSRRTHLRSSRVVEGGVARGILPRENENERAIVRARKRRCASRARCTDAECIAWICILDMPFAEWVSWITMDRYGMCTGNVVEESGRGKKLVRLIKLIRFFIYRSLETFSNITTLFFRFDKFLVNIYMWKKKRSFQWTPPSSWQWGQKWRDLVILSIQRKIEEISDDI